MVGKPQVGTGKPNRLVNRLRYGVKTQGEQVILTLGNADIEFDYMTAFEISQLLRFHAKEAKIIAGDIHKHWSILGNLRDIEDNFNRLILPNLRYSTTTKEKETITRGGQ